MSKIAIILINYNSTRLTKKCLQSLMATKDKVDEYHITILDNASKNPPKESDFPHAHLILSEKNLGFAQGNNQAVKEALAQTTPDYLLLLNNDTRVTRGMIRALVERFERSPDVGFVLPKIYFEHGAEYHARAYSQPQRGKVIWYAGGVIDWANMILTHKGIDEVDRGQWSLPTHGEFVDEFEDFATGCCLLTTPAIWKKLRGFDPKYFLYYEDADLSLRLQLRLGKQIVVEPSAILYHENAGSSSGAGSAVHQYYQTRNRLRFGLQYSSTRTKLALLFEARRLFLSGNQAVKLGILHAIGGIWGNQTAKIPAVKA